MFRRKKNQLTDPTSTPYVKMPRPVSAVSSVTVQGAAAPTIDALVATLPMSNGRITVPDPDQTIPRQPDAVTAEPASADTAPTVDGASAIDGDIHQIYAAIDIVPTHIDTTEMSNPPSLLPDLYLTPKLERALIALAIHTQQISERLDRVESRLDQANRVDPDVATKAEVLAVRRHSAQIAAELALLSVELRSEIERATTPIDTETISR